MNEQGDRPKRRKRYPGKNPRRFEEKYKEHHPEKYPETIAKVIASGKTPAGAHRPILVAEILEALNPKPGETAVDATLGFGGHALEVLKRIVPGGRLIGMDVDAAELPRTEQRLRESGFGADVFVAIHSNFAGISKALNGARADMILADLGVSSMQFDRPERGFSFKNDGPLDMRLNPTRGEPASAFLEKCSEEKLAAIFADNSDEPHAKEVARAIVVARGRLKRTLELADLVRRVTKSEDSVRRVFQAIRMEVNGEMSALDALLRTIPDCLNPGGRVAILTFHSGEDRRVKHAFKEGLASGRYARVAEDVIRPAPDEIRSNPRAAPAKLRWAIA